MLPGPQSSGSKAGSHISPPAWPAGTPHQHSGSLTTQSPLPACRSAHAPPTRSSKIQPTATADQWTHHSSTEGPLQCTHDVLPPRMPTQPTQQQPSGRMTSRRPRYILHFMPHAHARPTPAADCLQTCPASRPSHSTPLLPAATPVSPCPARLRAKKSQLGEPPAVQNRSQNSPSEAVWLIEPACLRHSFHICVAPP